MNPRPKRFFRPSPDRALPYLLAAPAVCVLLALSIYPLVYAVRVSLTTGEGDAAHWSFANFTRLAADGFFLTALAHTLLYALFALTFEFILGLGLALLLNERIHGRGLFRVSLLAPMMIPPVVVGVVWRLMLNPNFGAINGTLKGWGIDTTALTWT
ncbi:MAG: sugar ABC transporter permease, partial [Pyrinomonadaceae bacterium]